MFSVFITKKWATKSEYDSMTTNGKQVYASNLWKKKSFNCLYAMYLLHLIYIHQMLCYIYMHVSPASSHSHSYVDQQSYIVYPGRRKHDNLKMSPRRDPGLDLSLFITVQEASESLMHFFPILSRDQVKMRLKNPKHISHLSCSSDTCTMC